MPLTQRLPKLRGFRNPRQRWAGVPVDRLTRVEGAKVDLAALQAAGLAERSDRYVKIVGPGARAGASFKLDRKLSVTAAAVTGSAKKIIEAAGGSVTVTGGPDRDSSAKPDKESDA